MDYREYTPADYEKVEHLAQKHGLSLNYNSALYVAESEGKILSVIGVRLVPFIEPLVGENPVSNYRLSVLAEKMMKALGHKIIRIICKPERKELFEKAGYNQVFENHIICEKILK
jgi:hypothetical protein